MTEAPTAPTAEVEVLAPLVRRVVGARAGGREQREDVVQETLARVLGARDRLPEEALPAYSVAVARNLLTERGRAGERERRHHPRLLDPAERGTDGPEEAALRREEEQALLAAVAALPPDDRDVLLDHVIGERGLGELATRARSSPPALAARLARVRARARVDYVLSLRRVRLPGADCRDILLAVSAADLRRQRRLDVAGHLLRCPACPGLVDPLVHRRSALAGLVPVPLLVLGTRVRDWASSSPAQAVVTAGVVGALVGTSAVALTLGARQPPPRASAVAAAPLPSAAAGPAPGGPRAAAPSTGAAVPAAGWPPRSLAELRAATGSSRALQGVRVVAVPAPYGFWVSTGTVEVYVVLAGLPPRRVRVGDTVDVRGRVTALGATALGDRDLIGAADRARLLHQGTYLVAAGPSLRLRR